MNQVSEHPVKNCCKSRVDVKSKRRFDCFSGGHWVGLNDWLLGLTGAYCVISVMMNLLCMKPMSFGTDFIWMDGGLLISWIVFLISNVITEVYGKRQAIVVTGIATIVAFCMSVVAAVETYLPTLPEYAEQSEHFANIFSNGPRTIVSSTVAFFVGNVINVEIIDHFRKRAKKNNNDNGVRFTFRAIISTIVGQLVDNGLFQTLAFAPIGISLYEMRLVDIGTAILTSTAFETVVESFFVGFVTIPLTKYLKKLATREARN